MIADVAADFIYARLQKSAASLDAGYAPGALDQWRDRALSWARGEQPADLPYVSGKSPEARGARDVFIFFIAGAKERNPAAARALIERLA